MSADSRDAGPLSAADAALLASACLGPSERHQLSLLAHSLRTLQAIAGRCQGPPPDAGAIVAWAHQQGPLAGDPEFRAAFCRQLLSSADLLRHVAADPATDASGSDALALELEQLIAWCEQQVRTPGQAS